MPRHAVIRSMPCSWLLALLAAVLPACAPWSHRRPAICPQPAGRVEYRAHGPLRDRPRRPDSESGGARQRSWRRCPPAGVSPLASSATPTSVPADVYNFDPLGPAGDAGRRAAAAVGHRARGATVSPRARAMAAARLGRRAGLPATGRSRSWSRASEVVLPGCPDWSRDPGYDPRNLPLSNLGCANAFNLGLMVADPADLATTPPARPGRRHPRGRGHRPLPDRQGQAAEADIIQ